MNLSEHAEQALVVSQLRQIGVLCFSVPNEGASTAAGHARLAQRGRLKGAPDLLILSPPARLMHSAVDCSEPTPPWRGIAIEFKRRTGKQRDVAPEQTGTLLRMQELGWHTLVSFGAKPALDFLHALGYPVGTLGPPLPDMPVSGMS